MGLQEDLDNLTIVVTWALGIVGDVMLLFTEYPLSIFLAFIVIGMGFGIVRKFFRAKK